MVASRLNPLRGMHLLSMKRSLFSSIECLESRIAPAGLVTVTFSNGTLTISGADGADHDIEIVKTGTSTFRVEGNATGIDDVAQTSKSYRGTLNHVIIQGGVGADTFKLTNLSPLKSLSFDGDAGVDSLITNNLRTKLAAQVNIDLGADTGSVNFMGSRTIIHGPLNLDLGGGGTALFSSTNTTIYTDVTITGGLGSDNVSITGDKTLFKRAFTFTGADADDTFSATGNVFDVRSFVTMDGGAGANVFTFGADSNKFGRTTAAGLVDIKLGEGAGTVSFLGNTSRILGELRIDLGVGGGIAHVKSATVRNDVLVFGGAGNDTLEFEGVTSLAKSLSFFGDIGDDTLSATGSLFSVKGDTSMDGGSGAGVLDLNVTTIALAEVSYRGGSANDIVSIVADGNIAGNLNVKMGLDGIGISSTTLQSKTGNTNGLKFGGSVSIDMLGATVDVLTIANIQVAQSFSAQTGEGVSTVTISKLNVKGNITLRTGSGADAINIDNINAQNLYIDTEIGADEIRIERNALITGTSSVLGVTKILTGIGADQIRIGDATSAANTRVIFSGAMSLDAGDGANMRNDIGGSNSFVSPPSITATGGTLTETQAV